MYYLSMEPWVNSLSAELFWDVLQEKVDPDQHERWLVERVLLRGRWEDWLLISKYYNKNRLFALLPKLKLDAKSEHFLRLYCSL